MTTTLKTKMMAETKEALTSNNAGPQILEPPQEDPPYVIECSPFRITWDPGRAKVVKWWLSVGHAPELDDYFTDEYGPEDDLEQEVKVPMTGGDVYILLEYQLNSHDGKPSYHKLPIIECAIKDCTQNPCNECSANPHLRAKHEEESHH